MPAVAITAYQPSEFNALRNLFEARDVFVERTPLQTIEQKIGSLFLKYEVYNDLAMILLHRHFDMTDDEKLVEFGAVSTPWSYHQQDSAMMGGSVKPKSWLFKDGALVPYEFGYNEGEGLGLVVYKDLPNVPAFYEELEQLLKEEGLDDLLGLTLLTERKKPGLVKLEKTFGRSNVMFTMHESDLLMEKTLINAQWEYEPSIGDIVIPVKRYTAVCFSGCSCG